MKHVDVLLFINDIPRKMIQLHNQDHNASLAEFVLHDLCSKDCFHIEKAAFFVENPDFHCIKGVAGICNDDYVGAADTCPIWQKPEDFKKAMENSTFNNKVRALYHEGTVDKNTDTVLCNQFGSQLSFKNPACIRWHMKHGNGGILLFENENNLSSELKKQLQQCVYLLSLCPVH